MSTLKSSARIKSALVCVFFNILLTFAKTQNVGQKCTVQLTGKPGTCKESSQCPIELELANIGIKPTLCSRQGKKFIICCSESNNPPNPNPFSILDGFEDTDDNDSVKFPEESDPYVPNNRFRKSVQKCMEYKRIFTETVQVIPLIPNPKPVSVSVNKCDNSIPFIVGGAPARPGEFPHMAALGYISDRGIKWNCGGTLISEEFVVTAAHCAKSREGPIVRVRLGQIDLSQPHDEETQEVGVAQIIVHPQYRPPKKYNDIALVRLSRPVKLTRFITPACLKTTFDIPEPKAIVTGWGHTEYAGSPSPQLLKVALSLVSNNQCNKYYYNLPRQLPDGIRNTMVCAGEKAGGKDACQGDSGGPLQVARDDNSCLYDIIGITSFGKECANANTAGVFTRVSEYVSWIEGIVWP